jgi:WD40 repeat protein
MGFYKDWILVTGGRDGKVQMYDLSIHGNGDDSTFMSQGNFFTIQQKEKYLEESNEILTITVSECGLVFVMDKHENCRVYSVFHGKKIFKIVPGLHFSFESISGNRDVVVSFKKSPFPVLTICNSKSCHLKTRHRHYKVR